jgi:TRAP-type C4-dicarboxylate transport system substrate-binding protein
MRLLACLILCFASLLPAPASSQQAPTWVARYPLSPQHPAVAIGWTNLRKALAPEIKLELRLSGPRLGTPEALEALARGQHQAGIVPLASYPKAFPYWALLGEMFMVGRDPLAAAAAISELVMLECVLCQENLARQKLVFLGTYGAGEYGLIAPKPVEEARQFSGQTIATPGSLWDRLVTALDAAAAGGLPDPRQALAAGKVTALIDVPSALLSAPLTGHAIAFTRLPLGGYRGASPLTINRNAWAELSPEQRSRVFKAAAASLVQITAAYDANEAAALTTAQRNGATIATGSQLLQDSIRAFALNDLLSLVAVAEERFDVTDAGAFSQRLKQIFDKYATLLAPPVDEANAIALLQREIFDRLDPQTYGLE